MFDRSEEVPLIQFKKRLCAYAIICYYIKINCIVQIELLLKCK